MICGYRLRISGSGARFVSAILPHPQCGQPMAVRTVEGWENPDALTFRSRSQAEEAARLVRSLEGWFAMIEDPLETPAP